MTKLKLCNSPEEFFRAVQIKQWDLIKSASSGIKIYKDVLWMRLLELSEGMKLPNGCRFFVYIPFWKEVFPKGKKYYRFRSLVVRTLPENPDIVVDIPEDVTKRPWSIHSY